MTIIHKITARDFINWESFNAQEKAYKRQQLLKKQNQSKKLEMAEAEIARLNAILMEM